MSASLFSSMLRGVLNSTYIGSRTIGDETARQRQFIYKFSLAGSNPNHHGPMTVPSSLIVGIAVVREYFAQGERVALEDRLP